MDSIVHFEIPADDTSRASEFYGKTFGWEADPMPEMGYTMLMTTEVGDDHAPVKKGKINGGMFKRTAELQHPIVTIDVKDIDQSLIEITKNGGTVLRAKQSIGENMGFVAYFKDTEDNIVGLWQA